MHIVIKVWMIVILYINRNIIHHFIIRPSIQTFLNTKTNDSRGVILQ